MKKSPDGLLWPAPLKPGDKVAVTAPASPVSSDKLRAAVNSLRFLELEPVVMPGCKNSYGYIAGSDQRRAYDLNSAFACNDIKGIFCLRGGYGSMRILPLLDYHIIAAHPKIFIGFSDITALHTVINSRCGFITFHGPMPSSDYSLADEFTYNSLHHSIFETSGGYHILNPEHNKMTVLHSGTAEGILTGGNLSMLAATLGSPYEIDTKGKILFIEDIGEPSYRIDRMLISLSLAGKFRDCSGVVLGDFTGCEAASDVAAEIIAPLQKPILCSLQAGHLDTQITLPLGASIRIELNGSESANISVL
ncbi:MAG: LD-carboxypeptidase [Bacillota bacterium]|nr:LD-carboxypeptidase [Bacillota bacterium]